MYRFVLRPSWILSHLFALALVVLFVTLGFWQLDRHQQRADRNDEISSRSDRPAAPVSDLLDATPVDELRYRRATAQGRYVAGADLLVDNRSNDGLPGAWILTPLELDDGTVLVVGRGFQGFDRGRIDPPPAPSGPVAVEGTLVLWDERDCGVRTDDAGVPAGMACLRRSAAEEVVGGDVAPVVLQRAASTPADDDVFVPVPRPALDAGPHRGYAVQWFSFATIGLVGYPLILRRVARDKAREEAAEGDGSDDLVYAR